MSSARRITTDIGGTASSSGPSAVSTDAIRERRPEGSTTTSSPTRHVAARRPGPRSRGSRGGRSPSGGSPTAPGSGGRSRFRSPTSSTVSRCSSSVGPSYQGMRRRRGSTTLSPCSAEIGIDAHVVEAEPARRAPAAPPRSRGSAPPTKSTRSILLTATTTCGIAEHRGDVASGGASARRRPCARRRGSIASRRSRRR